MPQRDTGDPELGGFRPLKPGERPSPTKRSGYLSNDPFGYEEMGGPATGPSLDGGEVTLGTDEEKERKDLRNRYREYARKADWWFCRDIAQELLGRKLTNEDRAEATYALGFAQEMLENLDEAEHQYTLALELDGHHTKALGRLEGLNRRFKGRSRLNGVGN